jgi:FMN phosphatase YigB (HAD superfamily)
MNFPLAIFLDLDDTILAFTEVADDCWKSLCRRYADALPGVTPEALYAAVSRSREWFWSDAERHRVRRNDLRLARRHIVRRAFASHGIHAPDLAWQLADAYTSERETLVRPFPGAMETLQALHRRGVQRALLTNGAAGLQRAPQEVWMVGDHLAHDIAPALALGMQGIWVDYARTGLPHTAPCVPSRIIDALPELLLAE